MKNTSVSALLDLNHTIARALFEGKEHPWEVLPGLSDWIRAKGARPARGRIRSDRRGHLDCEGRGRRAHSISERPADCRPRRGDSPLRLYPRQAPSIGKNCGGGQFGGGQKLPYSSTTRRCRTSTTSATACSAIARTWARARSRPTCKQRQVRTGRRCARTSATSPPACASSAPCSATAPRSAATACSAQARCMAAGTASVYPTTCVRGVDAREHSVFKSGAGRDRDAQGRKGAENRGISMGRLFGTDGVRGVANEKLDLRAGAWRLGRAAAVVLSGNSAPPPRLRRRHGHAACPRRCSPCAMTPRACAPWART